MITSTSNQKVKHIMQLAKKARERRGQGVFLVEGIRMFRETPRDRIVSVYVSESFAERHPEQLTDVVYELVSDAVFCAMSDTRTPQGVMAVVRQPIYRLEQLLTVGDGTQAPLLLILENIQDPGNLGTMFRTGEGAGVTGIIMSRDCVDVYAPKTVRATMGSIYRVPFLVVERLADAVDGLKSRGITVYAAHLQGSGRYDAFDYRGGTAFLVGNEGNGLTEETCRLADCFLRIPMGGQLESLNAAVAAGILMYEANRQRWAEKGADIEDLV